MSKNVFGESQRLDLDRVNRDQTWLSGRASLPGQGGVALTQEQADERYWRYNCIILTDGSDWTAYANDNTGMAAAIAAAASGDTLWLPPCSLTASFTVPASVTLHGISATDCVLTGQVTLSDGSALESLSIIRSEDDAGAVYGIACAEALTASLRGVVVNVANATGAAYGIYVTDASTFNAYETELVATTGSVGYAAYVANGTLNHYSGRAVGTTALTPYWVT